MATKPRSSEGCWTCRLRRKKCDEAHPVCAGCATLEIDCLYSDMKPEWMDNGDRQKQKADELKAEVKRKAGWRRERRYFQSIENGTEDIEMTTGSDGEHVISRPAAAASSVGAEMRLPSRPAARTADFVTDGSSPDSGYHVDTSEASISGVTPGSSTSGGHFVPSASTLFNPNTSTEWQAFAPSMAQPSLENERELSVMMMYLDYIFPFLFPFYRPSLISSGRGWLLVLLMRNKALFHSAMSLASYFFTIVLENHMEGSHELCKLHNWEELQKQQELSLKELQNDIMDINRRGVKGHLSESARVMESIIQLLCFEVAIANAGNWPMHFDAALVLFDQMMEHHGFIGSGPDRQPSWHHILSQLASPESSSLPVDGSVPFNSEQAALRFFTTVLLHIDVVSSTALEQAPRLQKYHAHLLLPPTTPPPAAISSTNCPSTSASTSPNAFPNVPSEACTKPKPMLLLEDFLGVQNWVLLAIGNISALASWKKETTAAKKLSVLELVTRAAPIEAELRARLGCLAASSSGDSSRTGAIPQLLNAGKGYPGMTTAAQYGHAFFPPAPSTPDWTTRIWGHAALAYLLVVVNGWQPEQPDVRESVETTLALMKGLPTPACLRTVAWPFCVSGCLAAREQEGMFRGMVAAIGGLEMFGSVKEAMSIMESVWALRDTIEAGGGEWDLARCFNVLRRRAFLV